MKEPITQSWEMRIPVAELGQELTPQAMMAKSPGRRQSSDDEITEIYATVNAEVSPLCSPAAPDVEARVEVLMTFSFVLAVGLALLNFIAK